MIARLAIEMRMHHIETIRSAQPGLACAPSVLFVGSGAAARLHTRVLSRHFPQVRRGYSARSPHRARRLVREFGGEYCSGDWKTALRSENFDTAFVTTPPDTHLAIVLEALRAGKHVIVEKPAFLDVEEFDEVEEAAELAGRMVLVAENYFYKPLATCLRRLVEKDELGDVLLVQINAVKSQIAEGWRADPERAGGGALFEGGIHWMNLMGSLGLEIRRVRGFVADVSPPTERSAVVVLEYEEGGIGVLSHSWDVPSALRGLRLSRIWGTRDSIVFESNGLFVLRTGRRPRLWLPGLADIRGLRAMLTDFLEALRTGASPKFTLSDARRDVELVRAAYACSSHPDRQRKVT